MNEFFTAESAEGAEIKSKPNYSKNKIHNGN